MKLYKRVPVDRCTENIGLMCGHPAAIHPANIGGNYHEFRGGAMEFVEADDADIEEAHRESGY